MCESTAYVQQSNGEQVFLKDVVRITPDPNGGLIVENLLGEIKNFPGKISEIDFMAHKIVLAKE